MNTNPWAPVSAPPSALGKATANRRFLKISESTQDAANERVLEHYNELEREQIEKMTAIFNSIDTEKTGTISQDAFRKYVQKHPKGWPLVDLFRAKTMNQNERDMLVAFWFRKLDTDSDGTVTYADFINMFFALRDTKVQQSLYTDFLINLFDDNMDGLIDEREFTKMMKVLFGEEPPKAVLDQMPEGGFDRDGLTRVMHSVSMDYQLLPASAMAFGNGPAHSSSIATSGMYNLAATESRVWNFESGVFEVVDSSNVTSGVGSPNGRTVAQLPGVTASSSCCECACHGPKLTPAEAAKERNRERKRRNDRTNLALVVVVTTAITAGLCVFAGIYGRRTGKF